MRYIKLRKKLTVESTLFFKIQKELSSLFTSNPLAFLELKRSCLSDKYVPTKESTICLSEYKNLFPITPAVKKFFISKSVFVTKKNTLVFLLGDSSV
jgi:hypothetical protein